MNANRHHANRPTRMTAANRAAMTAAIVRHDRAVARAAARERVARLAVFAIVIVMGVAMFYGITG